MASLGPGLQGHHEGRGCDSKSVIIFVNCHPWSYSKSLAQREPRFKSYTHAIASAKSLSESVTTWTLWQWLQRLQFSLVFVRNERFVCRTNCVHRKTICLFRRKIFLYWFKMLAKVYFTWVLLISVFSRMIGCLTLAVIWLIISKGVGVIWLAIFGYFQDQHRPVVRWHHQRHSRTTA